MELDMHLSSSNWKNKTKMHSSTMLQYMYQYLLKLLLKIKIA